LFDSNFKDFAISDQDHELWYGEKRIADEMKYEQLEKKFYFGLEYFNISGAFF